MPEAILVRNNLALGDYVVLTAALRDIQLAHPGRFSLSMAIPNEEITVANPYLRQQMRGRLVKAEYPLIKQSNQNRWHFIWGFIDDLNNKLGTRAVLTDFRPALFLTEEEKQGPPGGVQKPYWLFASGGKTDFTAKWWDPTYWQTVVDRMRPWTTLVQVGGASHHHPKIQGVVDLVGKTSVRNLMSLIYHSEGVICVVTCLMHIAAAFNKPCITICGGREPWWWEAYTLENRLVQMRRGMPAWNPPVGDNYIEHRFLHTMGRLECCKASGCWSSAVTKFDRPKPGKVCIAPVKQNNVQLPRCLALITPDNVLESVEWYYQKGILSKNAPATVSLPPAAPIEKAIPLSEPVKPVELSDPGFTVLDGLPDSWEAVRTAVQGVKSQRVVCLSSAYVPARADWLQELEKRVNARTAAGIVYWAPAAPGDGLPAHPLDPARCAVRYLRPGFFAADTQVLNQLLQIPGLDWSDQGKIRIGLALHQLQVGLKDASDLVRLA